jgi:hypothetical protein
VYVDARHSHAPAPAIVSIARDIEPTTRLLLLFD